MGFLDYLILALIAACFVGSIVYIRKRKKQGKTCCGDCSCCSGCASCSSRDTVK